MVANPIAERKEEAREAQEARDAAPHHRSYVARGIESAGSRATVFLWRESTVVPCMESKAKEELARWL